MYRDIVQRRLTNIGFSTCVLNFLKENVKGSFSFHLQLDETAQLVAAGILLSLTTRLSSCTLLLYSLYTCTVQSVHLFTLYIMVADIVPANEFKNSAYLQPEGGPGFDFTI